MKYEDIVRKVCLCDWKRVRKLEQDGCIGIAVIASFLNGSVANPDVIAKDIGLSFDDVISPFKRLQSAGAFDRNNVRQDRVILGEDSKKDLDGQNYVNAEHLMQNSWCVWAGIASGFIGSLH